MNTAFKMLDATIDNVKFATKIAESINAFATLRKKPFTIIPSCLLQSINQELTGSARAIYFHIYGQAEKNFNSSGNTCPVIISAKTLAENHIFKSERTIQRRLTELEAKGYIFVQPRFNEQSGLQQSNAVWLSIPERLQQHISVIPNRRTTVKMVSELEGTNHSYHDELRTVPKETNNADLGSLNAGGNCCGDDTSNLVINDKVIGEHREVYDRYTKLVEELRATGLNIARANMKAYNMLSKEEQQCFVAHMAPKKHIAHTEPVHDGQICRNPGDKNVVHTIYNNNYIVNSKLHVDNLEKLQEVGKPYTRGIIVNLHKKITDEFIKNQIHKIKSELPASVFIQGKTIDDIVLEVQFHVKNRDPAKTKTPLHALNAAQGMLKNGTWLTPLRYVYAKHEEAIIRERLANQEKAQELAEIRRFISNSVSNNMYDEHRMKTHR